jgi:hypothetical protein
MENMELRFLRFSIQTKAPSFLGYNNSIKADKIFLLYSISKINELHLKEMVVTFLKSSKYLTPAEKQKIK